MLTGRKCFLSVMSFAVRRDKIRTVSHLPVRKVEMASTRSNACIHKLYLVSSLQLRSAAHESDLVPS